MDEEQGVFTIIEDGQTVAMFPAPRDSHVARTLWVFFVENLRPGLEVALVHEHVRLKRDTGQKVPIELYKRIMDDRQATGP